MPSCPASSCFPAAAPTRPTAGIPVVGGPASRRSRPSLIGTGARATQARARAIALVGDPRDLRGSRPADRPQAAFFDQQAGLARLCRTRCPAVARIAALHRPRDHAARPRAPLRHALSRCLAKRCRRRARSGGPTNELEELVWLPIGEAKQADIPAITRTVLEELEKRLERDPLLRPGGHVPFYRMIRNRFVRDLL